MIGILGLQGAFIEHQECLNKMDVKNIIVRDKDDFNKIDALIIPGGESTVIKKLLKSNNLLLILNNFIHHQKKPVMGICAGIILLADEDIKGLNIDVERNYYGSHTNSFTDYNKLTFSDQKIKGVYIRAPKINKINSNNVEILSTNERSEITGVKQENIIGFTFHPELTEDLIIHKYFISLL